MLFIAVSEAVLPNVPADSPHTTLKLTLVQATSSADTEPNLRLLSRRRTALFDASSPNFTVNI